jgi:hypothetical protein
VTGPQPDDEKDAERARRRRVAEVFGDVLPDTTSDERDEQGGDTRDREGWLRAQVPPHHG